MSQTSYSQDLTAKCPGVMFGTTPPVVLSRIDPVAPQAFGAGAMRAPGADDEVVKVPDTVSDAFAGVIGYSHAVDTDGTFGSNGDGEAPTGQCLNLICEGLVYVHIDEDVTPDDGVHLVVLAAGGDTPGHFRATADGVNTKDVSTSGAWLASGTAADGVGCLKLDV